MSQEFEYDGYDVLITSRGHMHFWPGIQVVIDGKVVTHYLFDCGRSVAGGEDARNLKCEVKSYIDVGDVEEALFDIKSREANGEDYSFE